MKHTKESVMELVTGGRALLLSAYEARLDTALTEVFAERDALLAACKLFLAYDACGSDDGYEMMAAYAAALEAIEAVVAKAEGEKA